jgi:LAS superfamily LD-carboxypeptidase LdcB
MSNIVGEGFNPAIIEQIKRRQIIYGSADRDNQILSFLNARTGWCKLVSSVDVKIASRNIPYTGTELAKNFVLFNGTTSTSTGLRKGIYQGTGDFNNFAYGMGGTDFGLRPMPGITQASIKTETRGSLKTATINIKANNRNQFDIIDVLYLRLGYSMLLEWGNSSYYNNSGGYVSNNPHSLANKFLEGEIKYDNYYIEIAKKVKESYGNYDAIVGKVVNFNWTFTKEGTYDITIILRSIGDVIESLKTNILLPGGDPVDKDNSPNTESSPNPTPEETIKDFANAHEIGKKFYKLQKQLEPLGDGGGGISKIRDTTTNDVIAFKQTYEKGSPAQYYIRLGYFLDFIKSTIIPYVDKKEIPLIDIDTDIKSNIIYLVADQVSTNPNICVFKKNYTTNLGRIAIITPGVNDFITTVPKSNDSPTTVKNSKNTYGRIMNIYFNMTWILTQMKNLKNTDGKVPLYDLLTALCNGWNTSTGNFNKLEVTVDNEEGIIRFIDEVPLPDRDSWLKTIPEKSTELASFDVYGYYYGQGNDGYTKGQSHAGFIKDISFNTTIPSSLATMITVGATSNGYVVGQDSTALSRMNSGFVDRFKEKIETHQDTKIFGPSSLNINYKEAKDSYNTFVLQLSSINGGKPTWNQEAINSFNNLSSTFYEYNQAKQTLEAAGLTTAEASTAVITNDFSILANAPASPSIGFLPFDLQLTMDGLSGMKVYQKYIADASFLPSNYPSSLEFIIKGITNTISNNEWITTLESIAVPKNPFGSVEGQGAVEAASLSPSKNLLSLNTNELKVLDPAPKINPQRIGSQKYNNSPTAKKWVSLRYLNGNLFLDKLIKIDPSNNRFLLAPEAAESWFKWKQALEAEKIPYIISSAYRSKQQQSLLASTQNNAAQPGSSPHGWGGALDFSNLNRLVGGSTNPNLNLQARVNNPISYARFAELGAVYGWYNPWRLSDNAGEDEIWHFEYWGPVK